MKKLYIFIISMAIGVSCYAGLLHLALGAGLGYAMSNHDCNKELTQYKQNLVNEINLSGNKKFTKNEILTFLQEN